MKEFHDCTLANSIRRSDFNAIYYIDFKRNRIVVEKTKKRIETREDKGGGNVEGIPF